MDPRSATMARGRRSRAARPVDHGRGVHRAPLGGDARRGRAHGEGGGVRARRRRRSVPRSSRMWLALGGQWSWDEIPALPRGDPATASCSPEHLRLRLLGAPDDRRAHRRRRAPAVPALPFASTSCAPVRARPSLAARAVEGKFELLDRVLRRYERHPLRWLRRTAIDRAGDVDPRPPGGRRVVGRDPAAVGVLAAALHLEGFRSITR